MSNVNLNIMYKFLATFGGNGKGWEEVADADNNQAITYGEFDKFTMSNQDDIFSQGNEDCDTVDELKDLINAFWNTVDTKRTGYVGKTDIRNKFALDDNEMKNIERNVERYNILSNFINNQTQPGFLTSVYKKMWKEMLEEKLGALLEASNLSGDELRNYLAQEYPRIAQECTAECAKLQYMNQLVGGDLSNESEYYRYGSDDTLNDLIQSYIEGLTEIKSPDEINNDIKAIINAYLAQAGINVEGGSHYNLEDLEALGYQANVLNDLQKAVLMPEMIEALEELMGDNYKGYEKQFKEAVQKFLDELGENGASFDSIRSLLKDDNCLSFAFNNSSAKQSLDALIHYSNPSDSDINEEEGENSGVTITTNTPFSTNPTIGNIGQLGTKTYTKETTTPSPTRTQITQYAEGSILRAAENLFGYSIARALDINGIDNPNSNLYESYQNIISEVCSRIESGYWKYPKDKAKIDAYILTQIFLDHEKFIGEETINQLSLEELKDIVDGLSTEDTDDETKRQIAIEYCEILERKGYGQIIKDVFKPNDYESIIKDSTISDIEFYINELDSAAIDARNDIEKQTPTVTMLPSKVSGQLSLNTKLEGVEYKTEEYSPNVTIGSHGQITISRNGLTESMTVKVYAEFDGIRSQSLEITIQPSQATQQSNGSTAGTSETEDVGNTAQTKDLKSLQVSDLSELGIDISGYLTGSATGRGDARDKILDAVEDFVDDSIGAKLKEIYDDASVDKACTNCKNYFKAVINELDWRSTSTDKPQDDDLGAWYDADGVKVDYNEELSYWCFDDDDVSKDKQAELRADGNVGIRVIEIVKKGWNNNEYQIEINRSHIANKFINLLNRL